MDTSKQKVVIWGHKLEKGHTHSFVHNAFYLAFKHLGYDVVWLDDMDAVETSSLENSIFLTEGQVDTNLPILKSGKYILHNCNLNKYSSVLNNCLNLQVYTKDCLKPDRDAQKIAPFVYYQNKAAIDPVQVGVDNRTLYMPWATNLLPHEINPPPVDYIAKNKDKHNVYWVGSVCDGVQGNLSELQEYAQEATQKNLQFRVLRVPEDVARNAIVSSYTAPAVQGAWQVEKGYIPCRVFKNISYGRMAGTNNPTVKELFQEYSLPFDGNPKVLFQQEVELEKSLTQEDMSAVVNFVKSEHTYLNRVQRIMEVL